MVAQHQAQEKKPETMPPKQPSTQFMAPKRNTSCLFTFTIVFLILAGITSLVVWLVYRPSKPHFSVAGAAIYDLNTTSSYLISTTMQFTVVIHNPNRRVAVYYDSLTVFVSYRNQAITAPVPLPPLFLWHHGTVAVSPMMGGGPVAVSPEVTSGIEMDEEYGVIKLKLEVLGRLRWKAGAFRSSHYGMYVKCGCLLGLKNGYVGQVPLLGSPDCSVSL